MKAFKGLNRLNRANEADRFSDDSVAVQVAQRSGRLSGLGLGFGVFNYEGSTTGGRRVSKPTVRRAKGITGAKRQKGVRPTRARTTGGIGKALVRGGVATGKGRLVRNASGRKLTGAQVRQRTKARAGLRNAGTAGGRKRTKGVVAAARRQGGPGKIVR